MKISLTRRRFQILLVAIAAAACAAALLALSQALVPANPTYSQDDGEATPTPKARPPAGPTPTRVSPEREREFLAMIAEWDKHIDPPEKDRRAHSDCDTHDILAQHYSVTYINLTDTEVTPRAAHAVHQSSVVSADFELVRNGEIVWSQFIADTDAFVAFNGDRIRNLQPDTEYTLRYWPSYVSDGQVHCGRIESVTFTTPEEPTPKPTPTPGQFGITLPKLSVASATCNVQPNDDPPPQYKGYGLYRTSTFNGIQYQGPWLYLRYQYRVDTLGTGMSWTDERRIRSGAGPWYVTFDGLYTDVFPEPNHYATRARVRLYYRYDSTGPETHGASGADDDPDPYRNAYGPWSNWFPFALSEENCGVAPMPTPPVVTLSSTQSSVTEGTSIQFTVTADRAPTSDLPVKVAVTQSGSFITGTTPTSVTIQAEQTSASFTVMTRNDSVDEPNGSVTATLQASDDDSYDLGDPSSKRVTVRDNDAPPPTPTPRPQPPPPPSDLELEIHPTALDKLNLDYSPSSWPQGNTHFYQFHIEQMDKGGWVTLPGTEDVDSATAQAVTFSTLTTGENFRAMGRRCADATHTQCSDWATSATYYLPDPPPAPVNLALAVHPTNPTELTLGYETSTWNWSGAPGHYYRLQLDDLTTAIVSDDAKQDAPTTSAASVSFTGVTVGREYRARASRCTFDTYTRCGGWGAWVILPPPPGNLQLQLLPNKTVDMDLTYDQSSWPGVSTHHYQFETREKGSLTSTLAFDQDGVSPYPLRGLTAGGTYEARGRRCADATATHCGFWADWVEATLNKLTTPADVAVVPMTLRRAKITWTRDSNATHFEVRRMGNPDPIMCDAGITDGCVIQIDDYLLDAAADIFTVQDLGPGTNYAPSDVSDRFGIEDSPIKSIDGDSGNSLTVAWRTPQGGVQQQSLVYRGSLGNHTYETWTPAFGSATPTILTSPNLRNFEIPNLTDGLIYAVQYVYQDDDGVKIFAARDAYGWPSSDLPAKNEANGDGGRVATYPYFGHWPDRTYKYYVCTGTFPDDPNTAVNETDAWSDMIQGAMNQWSAATAGLVMANRLGEACFKSTSQLYEPGAMMEVAMGTFNKSRLNVNEMYMVNDYNWEAGLLGKAVFGGFIYDLRGACVLFANVPACAISHAYGDDASAYKDLSRRSRAVDILFRKGHFYDFDNGLLRGYTIAEPAGGIKLGNCLDANGAISNGATYFPYRTALHEGGHGLGTSGFEFTFSDLTDEVERYYAAHPSVPDAVMNYTLEADCAPQPFDILGIRALYQTLD